MDRLQVTVKSATAQKEKEKKKTGNTSSRKEDLRKQTKEPATTSAGPFRPDQKPMQFYKCESWGHGWHECATKGNVNLGRVHMKSAPTEHQIPDTNQQ